MKAMTVTFVLGLVLVVAGAFTRPSQTTISLQHSSVNASNPGNAFLVARAHKQQKGIMVTWSSSGTGISGYVVEKTYQDPNDEYSMWEEVSYAISQTSQGAQAKKCYDGQVYPGYINYRVGAVMQDGSVVYSNVVTVRIVGR